MTTEAKKITGTGFAPKVQRQKMGALRWHEARWGLLFISPWLLGYLIFTIGPMIASAYLAFTKYDILTPAEWIGLDNFRYMFSADELFWGSVQRTLLYTLTFVPLALVGSLAVAMLLNQMFAGRVLYRALFYIPSITPVVAAVFVWKWMLNPEYGPVNYVLGLFGIHGPRWFADPDWARNTLIFFALWAYVGGGPMVVFLAALQGIPRRLYEAALIDGAGRWAQFWNVTIPMLTPTIFYSLILALVGSFQVFETAYAGTDGGPARATYFYVLHLYYTAFRYFNMGYASALAWALFLFLLIFTYVQFRYASRWVYYEAEV